jgi:hypothetical protein
MRIDDQVKSCLLGFFSLKTHKVLVFVVNFLFLSLVVSMRSH